MREEEYVVLRGPSSSEGASDPVDLAKLEEVARAATTGPWFRSGGRQKVGGADTHSVVATVDGKEIILASVWYDPRTHEGFGDANHIATFDPPTVLALIRYAALGQACEANGLGWYKDDGTMRFQAPADQIAECAVIAYISRQCGDA